MAKRKIRIVVRNGIIYIDSVDGLGKAIVSLEKALSIQRRIIEPCCVTDMYSIPIASFVFEKKDKGLSRGLCG